ncbi:MAG: ammonium transporter, partial [Methyloprofundus sp.]|nr:ammonium transporter [Methyloprofundus sp.]
QVGVQTIAVIVTIIWSVVFSYIILKVLDSVIGLRVSEDQEIEGLDIVLHEETGYHNL